MKFKKRVFTLGGMLLCSGFALLVGCSAGDGSSTPTGSSEEFLRKPAPPPPSRGPGHERGREHGKGHDHDCGPGHGVPGSTGSGGASNGGAASSDPAGGATASAGAPFGWAGSGGSGFGLGGSDSGPPGVCGDGLWGGGEQCDDGNTTSGDGCSSQCQYEPNYSCPSPGVPCLPVVCGDARQDWWFLTSLAGATGNGSGGSGPGGNYGSEQCDDGNATSGDGCSASCTIEVGWICAQPGEACHQPTCGDGMADYVVGTGIAGSGGTGSGGTGPGGYFESCDDGNTTSGDGCSASCTLEAGWICSQPGVACRQPACGDGFSDFIPGSGGGTNKGGAGNVVGSSGSGGTSASGYFEACDDGNTTSGDGCSATCSVEAGWSCWSNSCHVIVCGDGLVDYPAEQCDDGNSAPNDGCASCMWDNQSGGGSAGTSSGSAGSPGH